MKIIDFVLQTGGGGGVVPSGDISISANGTYDVSAFANAIVGVPNADNITREIMAKTISDYVDLEYSGSIPALFFQSCSKLTNINMPNVSAIGYSAFDTCTKLSNINSFTNVRYISGYAFYQCQSLTSVYLPNVITVYSAAFSRCLYLESVEFPNCNRLEQQAFYACSRLSTIILPTISRFNGGECNGYSALTYVSVPLLNSIYHTGFQACYALSTISLPALSIMGSSTFQSCYNLISVYLDYSAVCELRNTNAFKSTPISDYTTSTGGVHGSIYVPASLVTAYKAANNWSVYADRITAIV